MPCLPVNAPKFEEKQTKDRLDCYNLRARKRAAEITINPPPKRSRTLTIMRKEPEPKLIQASRETLIEGRLVLAKMRSYAPWPATIQTIRNSCVAIKFFGDDTTGTVPYNSIGLFDENHRLIISNLRKNIRGYEKAIRSAEVSVGIPSKHSVFNMI